MTDYGAFIYVLLADYGPLDERAPNVLFKFSHTSGTLAVFGCKYL